MGMTLGLAPDGGQHCPFWFEKSDSKSLVHLLFDPDKMVAVRSALGVDVSALGKSCDGGGIWNSLDDVRADIEDEAEAAGVWADTEQAREAAWQPTGDLVAALDKIIDRLGDASATAALRDRIDDEHDASYLAEGGLREDLTELRKMALWYRDRHVRRVRIEID